MVIKMLNGFVGSEQKGQLQGPHLLTDNPTLVMTAHCESLMETTNGLHKEDARATHIVQQAFDSPRPTN